MFDINKIQLKIQSPGVKSDEKLNTYIIGQIEKLGKLYDRIKKCEIMLHCNNDSRSNNCIMEAKLFVPGEVLFASEKENNFRKAAKNVFDDLHNQLYKFKEKLSDKPRVIE